MRRGLWMNLLNFSIKTYIEEKFSAVSRFNE